MKSHHKQVHGASIKGITNTCDHCGDEFTHDPSAKRQYCSHSCANTVKALTDNPMENKESRKRLSETLSGRSREVTWGDAISEGLSGDDHHLKGVTGEDHPGSNPSVGVPRAKQITVEETGHVVKSS